MNKVLKLIAQGFLVILFAFLTIGCSKPQNISINLDESPIINESSVSNEGSANKESTVKNDSLARNENLDRKSQRITLYTDEQKKDGYLIAITVAAFSESGYEATVEYMPWTRALNTVMDGKGQGLVGAYYSTERAKKMSFSNSVGTTKCSFFVKSNNEIKYNKLEDLKGYIIGIQRGVAISNEFDNAAYLTKELSDTPKNNIYKLLSGRIDLFLEQENVVDEFMRKYFPDDIGSIVALEPPLLVKDYYVAFSKDFEDCEQTVKDFNQGLKIITDNGTVNQLMKQYDHP